MKIAELMEGLALPAFRHVTVRRKNSADEEYVGGGAPSAVSRRFGNLDIKGCDIRENVLIIYVVNEN